MLLPWSEINTVFLDMDGTLLDLHFDNYFWLEYLPKCYAQSRGLTFEQGQQVLLAEFAKQQGQLTWYCLDHWSEKFNLPIIELKQQMAHLIKWREHAEFFLKTLNQMGKEVILVTNAHPQSLKLKMQKVDLAPWFKYIISSHDYGYPKESECFWQKLQKQTNFEAENSLFIDDSISILRTAKQYGIAYLCAIFQPDSRGQPNIDQQEFMMIKDYRECFIS